MPTFRRIKILATVETAAMLLPESEIAHTVGALRERLRQLDLAIVSLESIEAAAVPRNDGPTLESDGAPTSRLRRTA